MLAPLEDIAPHILTYWKMRKTDIEILRLLKAVHIDQNLHGIGYVPVLSLLGALQTQFPNCRMTSYKAIRKRLGLLSTRQQSHTLETIYDAMISLQKRFPKAGAHDMKSLLFHQMGMSVPRCDAKILLVNPQLKFNF